MNLDTFEEFYSISAISAHYDGKIRFRSGGGIDRITARRFERNKNEYFQQISERVLSGTYRFSPYLEKLVSKGRGKPPRMISIPTIRDKLTLSILNTYLQCIFPNCVKKELPNQKVRKIKEYYCTNCYDEASVVKIDIEKFYDSIDREILFKKLSHIDNLAIGLLHGAISNSTIPFNSPKNEREKYKTIIGISQGLPISNISAEIYIENIDSLLLNSCIFYDRYVDDIIAITADSESFLELVEKEFNSLKLSFNKEKTTICSMNQESTYLGYSFCQNCVSVKIKSYEKFISSINTLFYDFLNELYVDRKHGLNSTQGLISNFVEDLNIKIAGARYDKKRYGWIYYFSEINDMQLLHRIDSYIAKRIKQINIDIPRIKSAVRAFYHIKAKTDTSYSHNYNLQSYKDMLDILVRRKIVGADENLSPFEIESRYSKYVLKKISKLEEDLGKDY